MFLFLRVGTSRKATFLNEGIYFRSQGIQQARKSGGLLCSGQGSFLRLEGWNLSDDVKGLSGEPFVLRSVPPFLLSGFLYCLFPLHPFVLSPVYVSESFLSVSSMCTLPSRSDLNACSSALLWPLLAALPVAWRAAASPWL